MLAVELPPLAAPALRPLVAQPIAMQERKTTQRIAAR
jgi:hypothetical protein